MQEEEALKTRSQVIENLATFGGDMDLSDALDNSNNRYTFTDDSRLTADQKELLTVIREKFDPENVVADVCLMYEITGYMDESTGQEFWASYRDFFELGDDDNMVREDRLDERALAPERR